MYFSKYHRYFVDTSYRISRFCQPLLTYSYLYSSVGCSCRLRRLRHHHRHGLISGLRATRLPPRLVHGRLHPGHPAAAAVEALRAALPAGEPVLGAGAAGTPGRCRGGAPVPLAAREPHPARAAAAAGRAAGGAQRAGCMLLPALADVRAEAGAGALRDPDSVHRHGDGVRRRLYGGLLTGVTIVFPLERIPGRGVR